MSDAKRDEEPLTETDVEIDLDAGLLGSGVDVRSGRDTRPSVEPPTSPGTGEPAASTKPKYRMRAPTLVGVAPPSAGAARSQGPRPKVPPDDPGVPKIEFGVPEEETTTLVGKMLAEAAAQARRNLEETGSAASSDTYQDETATTVGDAERLIATANEAFAKATEEADALEESTADGRRRSAHVEETTAKRDAINVDGVLARAAELKAEAEAEARRKKAAKKRTFVGLGTGPLKLPANKPRSDESDALEGASKLVDVDEVSSLDDETVSRADLGRLNAPEPPPTPLPEVAEPLGGPAPNGMMPKSDYTERMPNGPPVRLDRSGGLPLGMPPPSYDLPPATPTGGVPHSPFAPMHGLQAPHPRSDPAAFAQTQRAPLEAKKSRAGLVLFLLVLVVAAAGGVGWWQRAPLIEAWEQYRDPPAAETAAPAVTALPPSAAETAAPPPSASAAASAEPPAAASASASASASAAASAKPAPKPAPKVAPKKAPAKRKTRSKRVPAPAPTSTHGF